MRSSSKACPPTSLWSRKSRLILFKAGGKRLRPLLVLLAARASGYQGSEHIKLAVIIEFLHTAMLLHDDVVDNSIASARQSDCQCDVGQRRQRAGWRLPALARL